MKFNLKIILLFWTLGTMVTMTSCDSHEAIDLNIYPGYVLCNDNTAMPLSEYMAQSRIKAVGVVFAASTDKHPALAVMLEEFHNYSFSDSIPLDQGTSCSLTEIDGIKNTISLQNSSHSPIADVAFRAHTFGQSDYIPSLAEMRMLVASIGVVNPVIKELGGTPISTEAAFGKCWYWTSTEVAENKGNQAWLVSCSNGSYLSTPKDEGHSVRTIVSLNF